MTAFARPAATAPPDPADPRPSLRASLRDVVAFSVMVGAGESYLSAFALFLRASAQDVAWLASVPPLVGSWMQLVSAWLVQAHGRRRAIIVGGALAQALTWLPIAALPLLFERHAVAVLIAGAVLYHASSSLIQPHWASLMGDLVPEGRRGRFFARRNRRAAVSSFTAMLGAGAALDACARAGHTLAGFLLVFAVAAGARLVSAWFLGRMDDPEPPHGDAAPPVRSWLAHLGGSAFLRFSITVAAMQGATAVAAPFFAVLMLRDYRFSYLEYTAVQATSVMTHFVTLTAWGRISDRFGNRLVLVVTGFMLPFIPALWLLSPNPWYLVALQLFSGLGWGGFNLSTTNYLYDLRPGRPLARWMAVHGVLVAASVFLGASIGGAVSALVPAGFAHLGLIAPEHPLYVVLGLSALCRLTAALVLHARVKEVREVRRASVRELAYRMARFNAVSVIVLDVVAAARRRR